MSCDQQLKETCRELEILPRQTDSKDKNLSDQLQALEVQVHIYIYAFMYTCIYVCTYVYIYLCKYI